MTGWFLDEYVRQMVLMYYWPYFLIGNGDDLKDIMLCKFKR
jgi:hypothetical protein